MKNIHQIILTTSLVLTAFNAYAAEHEIKMLNSGANGSMVFEPGFLKVAPGDTVKFIPTDAGHNTTSYSTPDGGASWSSDFNQEITVTMDKEGVYIYKCTPHLVMAMVGVIQVGKASNLNEAKTAATTLSAKFVMSKDRLDNYMAKVK